MSTKKMITAYAENLAAHVDNALIDIFNVLDVNGDGFISVDEFKGMNLSAWAALRSFGSWPNRLVSLEGWGTEVVSYWASLSLITKYMLIMFIAQGTLFSIEHTRCFFGFRCMPAIKSSIKGVRVEKCEKSLALTYDTPMRGVYERFKLTIFILSGLAFVRLIQALFFFTVAMVCMNIAILIHTKHWFTFWCRVARFCGYSTLFSLGYYKINSRGTPAKRHEAKILVANHICIVEVILLFIETGMPSFVSRIENEAIPFFGGLIRATESILVDRENPSSRNTTLDEITRRARDPKAPQIMIFPEGTCSNQKALFRFKRGSFEAGCPVQPICFKMPYKHFNPAWTGRCTGGLEVGDLILRMVCQFVNRCDVYFLPVYTPAQEEKEDCILFATNVMHVMADQLQIPVSDATFNDYKIAARQNQMEKCSYSYKKWLLRSTDVETK